MKFKVIQSKYTGRYYIKYKPARCPFIWLPGKRRDSYDMSWRFGNLDRPKDIIEYELKDIETRRQRRKERMKTNWNEFLRKIKLIFKRTKVVFKAEI